MSDVGVMSGCILFIQRDLHINEVQQEVLVGCLSFISLLGSLAGGRTSDAIGRKWTIGLAAVVFQAGAAVMTFAPSFRVLMIGRLLAGIGIGFGVMIAPVYIAEISPAASRGSVSGARRSIALAAINPNKEGAWTRIEPIEERVGEGQSERGYSRRGSDEESGVEGSQEGIWQTTVITHKVESAESKRNLRGQTWYD